MNDDVRAAERRVESLRPDDCPNPFCDISDPAIQDDERRILKRLAAGEELNVGRVMAPDGPDRAIYGNYFYWSGGGTTEIEQDWAVLRLLGRQLVRPVRCAGGATWIRLTLSAPADAAGPDLGRLEKWLRAQAAEAAEMGRFQSYEPTYGLMPVQWRERATNLTQAADALARRGRDAGEVGRLREERDKLQAFKDWCHSYLDRHGVPHHPPGTHGAAGCRIGDRMDWLMERVRLLEAACKPFAAVARTIPSNWPADCSVTWETMPNGHDRMMYGRHGQKVGPTVAEYRDLAALSPEVTGGP